MAEEQHELGPSLLGAMWRYRTWLVVVMVLCGLLGYLLSSLQAVRYEATTTILFRDAGSAGLFDTGSFQSDPERFVAQQANRLLSRTVLEQAAGQLPGETVETLEESTEIEVDVQLNQVRLVAGANTPEASATKANEVAAAYESVARQENLRDVEQATQVIDEQITELRESAQELNTRVRNNPNDEIASSRLRVIDSELLALEGRATDMAANATVAGSGVRFREPAIPEPEPAAPRPLRNAILAAIVGLLVASAVAYWRAGSTRQVETRADPGSVLNVPLLGDIPRFKRGGSGLGHVAPGSAASEAYEFVLSSIEFTLAELGGSSVLITSAAPGDGKTSTSLHLAMASAREGRNVVLVDTDVRAHGLTSMLRTEGKPGLVQLADGTHSLDEAVRQFRVSESVMLSVVPSGDGHEDATGLMRETRFKDALETIKQAGDLTILDSPPLLAVADATVLAARVDAVVLVVDRRTPVDQLLRVQERLAFVSTPLIGYIYNRSSVDKATAYGYTYGKKQESAIRRLLPRRLAAVGAGADSGSSAHPNGSG